MSWARAKRGVDKLLEATLVALFFALVLVVLWQVVSRYLLGAPSSFTTEVARFSFMWLAMLGAAYVAGQEGHLAIDLFSEGLSERGRSRHQLFVTAVSLAFALLLAGGGVSLVAMSWSLGQTSPVLGVPLSWVYGALPLSGVLLAFYTLARHQGVSAEPGNPSGEQK